MKQDKEKDRRIIDALKDQITKLKQIVEAKNDEENWCNFEYIIKELKEENSKLK